MERKWTHIVLSERICVLHVHVHPHTPTAKPNPYSTPCEPDKPATIHPGQGPTAVRK